MKKVCTHYARKSLAVTFLQLNCNLFDIMCQVFAGKKF